MSYSPSQRIQIDILATSLGRVIQVKRYSSADIAKKNHFAQHIVEDLSHFAYFEL